MGVLTNPTVLRDLKNIRENRGKLGEAAQALMYEIDQLKRQVATVASLHSRELHAVVIARCHKTTAGGAAVEVFNVPGVRKGMICLAQVSEKGATPVYVESARCLLDQVELTFTADPADDHEVDFVVFR